jgi:hypothetical protein
MIEVTHSDLSIDSLNTVLSRAISNQRSAPTSCVHKWYKTSEVTTFNTLQSIVTIPMMSVETERIKLRNDDIHNLYNL